jgi:sec-independent protein translocase protein TatC
MANDDHLMSFIAHLEELRTRLIKIIVALCIGFVLCYYVSDELFKFAITPLKTYLPKNGALILVKLQEGFVTYLKLSFISSLFLTSPFSFYQIWLFIAPGLYKHEKRYVMPFVFLASLFFVGGAAFCYYIVMPVGISYFLTFAAEYANPNISVQSYLNLVMTFVFTFGVIFELPLIMVTLYKIGLVDIKFLNKNRKYAILVIFIVAAILTPPDVVSQFMMAIPLLALYELSIILIWLLSRTGKKKTKIARE